MSCGCGQTCTCGCCAGTGVATPVEEMNALGLSSIAYRMGTWATFKESMLARLSSSNYPALAGLKTRADDDFSIALLDASAVVLDILTFYQERLANESYLRTATQLYSLTQLSQLIGYQPSPGVSASAYLAFTLASAPGLPPNPNTTAITIPAGTTVQSVPAQGQTAQMFQTSAPILAKPDWNKLPVQTGNPWMPQPGDMSVYLHGTSTQLNPGDAILVVGNERIENTSSTNWDVCIVSSVTPDTVNQRTLITWSVGLNGNGTAPAQHNPQVYALRQKASLFGYNAMQPMLLDSKTRAYLVHEGLISGKPPDWAFGQDDLTGNSLASESLIDLDSVYSKIVPNSWVVLLMPGSNTTGSPAGTPSLYYAQGITSISRSDYGASAKISRLQVDQNLTLASYYASTRTASVLAQAELLPADEQPLDYPLYGTVIDLENLRDDLAAIQAVAITGSNPQLVVMQGYQVTFTPYDGNDTATYSGGATFTLLQPPQTPLNADGTITDWSLLTSEVTLVVIDPNGRMGTIGARPSNMTAMPAPQNAPIVQEVAQVASVSLIPSSQNSTALTPGRTRIVLSSALLNCYDRYTSTVNANVGAATGGSPVAELLGSGAAATPNQTFTLKQSPLTYTQAQTPSGSESSLTVQVNGAAWTLVPSLYNQPPQAQVFTSLNLSNGKAQVIFGDNVEGSTVPTGQNNIMAQYRVGSGSAGNVSVGAISMLVDRPVGVSGVTNPMAATGGQDAQTVEGIRTYAPMSVQTLGRAVSITDYQNFTATFAGIAKADAEWLASGYFRGVFVTVASTGGVALPPGNLTLGNLQSSLIAYGNPAVPVFVTSFWETLFGLEADLMIDPRYTAGNVQAAVVMLLNTTYGFANRDFGLGVSGDEIASVIQTVPGVIAVNVTKLKTVATSSAGDLGSAGYSVANWQTWIQGQKFLKRPCSGSPTAICPYVPGPRKNQMPDPAEILVISPNPNDVVLGVMK